MTLNTPADPQLQRLVERVKAAAESATKLDIQSGNTKRFYGEPPQGEPFDVSSLKGISSYEPSELVVTARCGTPLRELEATLAAKGQCLPFEPPHLGPTATVGGMVAAGLAGPPRATAGGVRDYVLGATLLNGRGEVLSFGGQVMKNVAGYDVSRVLSGSMGTLGVICEVSLKVLPIAPATATLRFEFEQAPALDQLNAWGGKPLPLNASAWWSGMLVVRLRGAVAAVDAAMAAMGGERVEDALAESFWSGLREHTDEYFAGARAAIARGNGHDAARLWRISVPQTAAPLPLAGDQLVEWGGAQRWLCTIAPAGQVREAALQAGGHATLFEGHDKTGGVFTPPKPPLDRIHRELKHAFDPAGVFNPGRLYPDL